MVHKIKPLSISIIFLFFLSGCVLPFAKPEAIPAAEIQKSTENPTVEPTISITAAAGAEESATNPCYNIFYPLVPGNQWVYKLNPAENSDISTPDPNDTKNQIGITVSSREGNQANLDALNMESGIITQTVVECDNGAIKNFPMLTMSLIFGDQASGAAEIEYQEGIFMPAETRFIENNWNDSWSGDYILRGNFTAQDEEDQMVFTITDSPMNLKWESKGIRESVEVPAGSFPDAIRLDRETEMNISIQLATGSDILKIDGVLTFQNTLWYQPNIGLLKEEVHTANVTYRGMTFPVVVTGDLELLEFRPAD